MKKYFLIFAVIGLLAANFCSCEKEEDEEVNDPIPVSSELTDYETLTVDFNGTPYSTDSVKCICTFNDEETLNLQLVDVKFVPQMPVTISPTIANVSYTKAANGEIKFSADSIIPTLGGNPYTAMPVTKLCGIIVNNKIGFEAMIGSYETYYGE